MNHSLPLCSAITLCLITGSAVADQYDRYEREGGHDQRPMPHSPYLRPRHQDTYPDRPAYGRVPRSGIPQRREQVAIGFSQSRANKWREEHRPWGKRGGYVGYRIPKSRFAHYFGPEHRFRIVEHPIVFVGGFPRFLYDGFWLTFYDPWPNTWAPGWWETDDVYVDWVDDGYYLINPRHPGARVALSVTF